MLIHESTSQLVNELERKLSLVHILEGYVTSIAGVDIDEKLLREAFFRGIFEDDTHRSDVGEIPHIGGFIIATVELLDQAFSSSVLDSDVLNRLGEHEEIAQ